MSTDNEARALEFCRDWISSQSEAGSSIVRAVGALLDSIEREAVADHHGKGDCGACNSISLAAAHVARNDLRRLAGLQPFGSPGNEETFRDIIAAERASQLLEIRERCGHSCIPTEIGCVVCARSQARHDAIESGIAEGIAQERNRVLALLPAGPLARYTEAQAAYDDAIKKIRRAIEGKGGEGG